MNSAAVRRLAVPSPDELIARARAMVPEIRALAEETERSRKLFPHIVEKIREVELLRTCRPAMFGGFEYDGEVALKIALTISAACASTGWTVNGAVSNGLSLAHWSIEARSEEHTSELQSHSDLVCRLLLEKKKKFNKQNYIDHNNL